MFDPATPDYVLTYEYDAADRLVAKTSPNGAGIQFRYDEEGRLLSTTESEMVGIASRVIKTEYDSAGNVVRESVTETDPSGSEMKIETTYENEYAIP